MSLYHQDKTDGSTKTGARTVRLWRNISTCSGANIDRVQWFMDIWCPWTLFFSWFLCSKSLCICKFTLININLC